MTNYLYKKFHANIKNLEKICDFNSAIIAISGGQDSLCLIKLVQDFNQSYNVLLNIHYIYIDHQWKKDSKKQVKHLINLIGDKENIFIYQIKHIITSESKARKLRYQILIKHALKYRYPIIITGHTETDRIETFWQQILRGTSIDGATSLTFQRILRSNIQMWRPLINFKRIEITWFCRKYYLPIWSDITNYEYMIKRNRLRNEFIPYLKKYFWKNIEKNLNSFLKISEMENEYMKQNAIKLYLKSCHPYNAALNYSILEKQHLALQARTIQIFFYHHFHKCLPTSILQMIILKIQSKNIQTIIWQHVNIKIYNHWLYIY